MNMRTRQITASLALCAALLVAGSALADPQAFQRSYELEVKRDYAGALTALQGVPGQQRSSYLYALRRGWLSYLLGQYPQAVAAYRQAVQRAPRAIEPLLGMTLPLMAQRAWVDAAQIARRALALDGANYLATSRLALSTYRLGRYGESARLYQRLVELYPSDVSMRVGWGWALLKQRKRGEASRAFSQALQLSPKNASARAGLSAAGG